MMLVGGSLVLLTSTSPFTSPPAATEPSTPNSARVAAITSDQTRLNSPVETTVDRSDAVSALKEPDAIATEEARVPDLPSTDDDAVAALGEPLTPEAEQASQEDTAEGMAAADEAAQPDGATTASAEADRSNPEHGGDPRTRRGDCACRTG